MRKNTVVTIFLSFIVTFVLVACNNSEYTWEENDAMIELTSTYWNETFSGIGGYIINLKSPLEGEAVTFTVSVDEGLISYVSTTKENGSLTYVKNENVSSGTEIMWSNLISVPPFEDYPYYDVETAFIDIIIKKENHIIGYAVIKIHQTSVQSEVDSNEMIDVYVGELMTSKVLPKLNGEYQVISEEEILDIINNVKQA